MHIDRKKIACENLVCQEKICDVKAYKKWALKNHPDKFDDPQQKKVAQELFGKVATCKDDHLPKGTFCPAGRKECPKIEAEPDPQPAKPRVLKPKPARVLALKPPKEPEPEPEPEPAAPENGKCKQCTATAKSTNERCLNKVSCRKKANTDFCFRHQPKRGRKSKKSTKR